MKQPNRFDHDSALTAIRKHRNEITVDEFDALDRVAAHYITGPFEPHHGIICSGDMEIARRIFLRFDLI